MNRRAFGNAGEDAACVLLRKRGMKILERNVRLGPGEIDIIACERKTYVFVEVKRRSSAAFGTPAEAVNAEKQRRIVRTAALYLEQKGLSDVPVRFDVVEVLPEDIRLIKDAFDATGLL